VSGLGALGSFFRFGITKTATSAISENSAPRTNQPNPLRPFELPAMPVTIAMPSQRKKISIPFSIGFLESAFWV
jgi:hypothetical protein